MDFWKNKDKLKPRALGRAAPGLSAYSGGPSADGSGGLDTHPKSSKSRPDIIKISVSTSSPDHSKFIIVHSRIIPT